MGGAIHLDGRLSAIARMVPPCGCVADIGADHGLLGAYLLKSGRARRVQFIDISAPSLEKARRLIAAEDLEDRAAFSVGDGASALVEKHEAAVIAGMGGQLIADIVEAGRAQFAQGLLVLQPNVAQYELRARLCGAGFEIVDEDIVRAGRRYYVVLCARAGRANYDYRQLMAGPVLLGRRHPRLKEYAVYRLGVAQKALAGAERGGAPWVEELRRECACWKEVASCL